jgi:threo-3-hydroxy-L-aspartate ammonia-lyase
MVGFEDIKSAAACISGIAHRTPVMTSRLLDVACGARVFLKCENFQRGGAFKFRGAYHAVSRLSEEERRRGVITYSSGNHGQALALVCQITGVRATIVMPEDAPSMKIDAVRSYGAEAVLYNPAKGSRKEIAEHLSAQHGYTIVPPFDHPDIIAGQGTAAMELLEEVGPLDYLFVPCGGGGLLSGTAIVANRLAPGCKVVGVEPEAGDDGTRSFRTRTLQTVHNPETIADGTRTPSLGEITFPIIRSHVQDMLGVGDPDLVATMYFVWTRMKMVVEPTGVLGLSAVFRHRYPVPEGKRTGIIISGGNVDVASAARWFSELT